MNEHAPWSSTFTVKIDPPNSTHQAALRILKSKSGKMFVGKLKNSKINRWCSLFEAVVQAYKPPIPLDAPIRMKVKFFYAPPKYLIKECKNGDIWKTTKPDTDNLVKAVKDSLARVGFFVDDSRICDETVCKFHSLEPRMEFEISTHTNDTTSTKNRGD